MTESFVVHLGREALMMAFILCGPVLVVALLVGLAISVLQAATQVQEQMLTFVPKILAAGIILFITSSWLMRMMVNFTADIFTQIPNLVR